MQTYRTLVYMVLDELKILSDDSLWENEHIIQMLNKYRALLFSQKYKGKKVEIPFSFYQRLNVSFGQQLAGTNVYKSTKKVPNIIDISGLWQYAFISASGVASENLNFVNPSKFKFSGLNKWLVNQAYITVDYNNYMYIKKSNPSIYNQLVFDVILDNPIDINDFNSLGIIDYLDIEFPCDEALIQPIIDLCLKELGIMNQQDRDTTNNASDDASVPKQKQQAQQ